MHPAWLLTFCTKLLHPPPLTPPDINLFHSPPPSLLTILVIVQLFSCIRLLTTPWTAAHQASLSITNFWSLLKLVSIESSDAIQPSHPLLPPFFSCSQSFPVSGAFPMKLALSISWPKYWSFSFDISPSNESSGISLPWLHALLHQSSAPTRRGLMDQPSQDSCSLTHPSLLCLGEFSWSSSPDKPSILDYMLMGATQVVLVMKNLPADAGDIRDLVSTPGSGRSPGRGNGNPLQYSYLEKPMDRGAWQATVHGVAKSQTRLTN